MDDTHLLDESRRRRLIVDYVGTVRRIAYGIARRLPRDVSVDDLIGAGMVGLADALVKHNGHSEAEFAAYLGYRVRGAIADELRRCDPLTRARRQLERSKQNATRELTRNLGRNPRESEVAGRMGIPIAQLRDHALCNVQRVSNFDPASSESLGGTQYADETLEAADAGIARYERRERLLAGLRILPERLQQVLRLYYEQDYSLREIGEALGVSESRVCQLHREAIGKLRATFTDGVDGADDGEDRLAPASGWV